MKTDLRSVPGEAERVNHTYIFFKCEHTRLTIRMLIE